MGCAPHQGAILSPMDQISQPCRVVIRRSYNGVGGHSFHCRTARVSNWNGGVCRDATRAPHEAKRHFPRHKGSAGFPFVPTPQALAEPVVHGVSPARRRGLRRFGATTVVVPWTGAPPAHRGSGGPVAIAA